MTRGMIAVKTAAAVGETPMTAHLRSPFPRPALLPLCLALTACPLVGLDPESLCEKEKEEEKPPVRTDPVVLVLTPALTGARDALSLAPITFEGATGLRAGQRRAGEGQPLSQVEFTPGEFVSGTTDDVSAWKSWFGAAREFGERCAAGAEDCDDAAFRKSVRVASGTLEARAGDAVLARWSFTDAWPAALTAGDDGRSVVRLVLAAEVTGFSFAGAHPALAGLCPDGACPAAHLPEWPLKADEEQLRAYRQGVELFRARYAGPDEAIEQLELFAARDRDGKVNANDPVFRTALAPPTNFKIEIDGVISGGFKEISGLESEVEIVEYRDGSDPIVHKRPGRPKYKNIVLKRGQVNDASLLDWYRRRALAGDTARKSGSIIYLDREGNEVLRYNFFEAWPCRWKAPELNSASDTHIVEEIEFVVERVERA